MMNTYIGTKIIQAEPLMRGDDPGYFVRYSDGYSSWSPKKVFDDAYRPANAMSFGLAVEALKKGMKVSRAGWNGKGMWLMLVPESLAESVAFQFEALKPAAWIGMKTADEKFVPWLASQTDVLADDWAVIV